MGDQRIEGRTTLGLVNCGDRPVRGRVGGETVDRLGRHRHEPARAQNVWPAAAIASGVAAARRVLRFVSPIAPPSIAGALTPVMDSVNPTQ